MKIASIIMTLLVSSCSIASSQAKVESPKANQAAMHQFTSDGSGFNTHSFFFDNGEEIVVFDAQFTTSIAKDLLAFIRTKSKNPITHVIISHPNPDKFNGVKVFQEIGAKVVASKETASAIPEVHAYKKNYFVSAGMFTNENYPSLAEIDQTFSRTLKITLKNGDTLELNESSKPGVSSNQTTTYIPSIDALIVGDLIHHKSHSWLEGGIFQGQAKPHLDSWIEQLNHLPGTSSTTVYGGRGEKGLKDIVVASQIEYLLESEKTVESYIDSQSNEDLQDPKKSQVHFKQIQSRLEEAFPSFENAYLIQYGVYGLFFDKLSE